MDKFTLENVVALIVLIATGVTATTEIFSALKRPILWVKRRDCQSKQLYARLDNIDTSIKELKQSSLLQSEQISKLDSDLSKVNDGNKVLMRQQMDYLYNHHKDIRKLTERESENLEDIYRAYVEEGGNGHYKKLYERMKKWEVIPDEEDGAN